MKGTLLPYTPPYIFCHSDRGCRTVLQTSKLLVNTSRVNSTTVTPEIRDALYDSFTITLRAGKPGSRYHLQTGYFRYFEFDAQKQLLGYDEEGADYQEHVKAVSSKLPRLITSFTTQLGTGRLERWNVTSHLIHLSSDSTYREIIPNQILVSGLVPAAQTLASNHGGSRC